MSENLDELVQKQPIYSQGYQINQKISNKPLPQVVSQQTASNVDIPNGKSLTPLSYDTVQIKTNKKAPKKKLSFFKKCLIGLGGLAECFATLFMAAMLIMRRKVGKLTKLYKENLIFQNLAKKITFTEAKTVEEGIKFAKDVLKVEEVDKNFTLDAINFVNRGLVDVSNANKGKLFIPKKLLYSDMGDNVLASVVKDVESERFGYMSINKKFFNNKFLNEIINKLLGIKDKSSIAEKTVGNALKAPAKEAKNATKNVNIQYILNKETMKFCNLYKQNPESLTINQKRVLCSNLVEILKTEVSALKLSPLNTLKSNIKLFEKNGIKVNIEEFSKLNTEQQSENLKTLFLKLQEKVSNTQLSVFVRNTLPEETIYHEMGHLQDFAKNLKELDLKQWKFPSFKDTYKQIREGKTLLSSDIEYVANRWLGLTYDGFEKLFKNNPNKFKRKYPDLYEFLTNQKIQQTVGRVSPYSTTSIGEFIAETYAKMIQDKNISDEIMALYKKYNGPLLAA